MSRALAQLQPLKVNNFHAEHLHPTFTMVHYSTVLLSNVCLSPLCPGELSQTHLSTSENTRP